MREATEEAEMEVEWVVAAEAPGAMVVLGLVGGSAADVLAVVAKWW